MRELNKDKIQIKYITGMNKTQNGYPTPLDILYDSCTTCAEENKLFSKAKIENTYFTQETDADYIESRIDEIISFLIREGFVEKNGSSYKIIKTIWD